jgi:hypothetical protein
MGKNDEAEMILSAFSGNYLFSSGLNSIEIWHLIEIWHPIALSRIFTNIHPRCCVWMWS